MIISSNVSFKNDTICLDETENRVGCFLVFRHIEFVSFSCSIHHSNSLQIWWQFYIQWIYKKSSHCVVCTRLAFFLLKLNSINVELHLVLESNSTEMRQRRKKRERHGNAFVLRGIYHVKINHPTALLKTIARCVMCARPWTAHFANTEKLLASCKTERKNKNTST